VQVVMLQLHMVGRAAAGGPQQAAAAKRLQRLRRTRTAAQRPRHRLAVDRRDDRHAATGQQVPVVRRHLDAGRVQLVDDHVTVEVLRQQRHRFLVPPVLVVVVAATPVQFRQALAADYRVGRGHGQRNRRRHHRIRFATAV